MGKFFITCYNNMSNLSTHAHISQGFWNLFLYMNNLQSMNDINDYNLYKLKFMIKQSNYIIDVFDKVKPTRDSVDEDRISLIDYGIRYPNNLFITILLDIVKPRLTFVYWMKMFELGLYRGRFNFFNILDN